MAKKVEVGITGGDPVAWKWIAVLGFVLGAFLLMANSSGTTEASSKPPGLSLGHVERASEILPVELRSARNQRIGKLEDMLVDLDSGRILYAVVSAGGVLGIGERLLAIPPGIFEVEGSELQVKADKPLISASPEYVRLREQQGQMESPSFVSGVYRHFGETSWWQGVTSSSSAGQFGNVHRLANFKGFLVRDNEEETLGMVEDAIVNLPAGRVIYIIVAPEKKLGLSGNLYALPPNALALSGDKKKLVTDVDRAKLEGAPHFRANSWPDFSSSAMAVDVYNYYGKRAFLQNPNSAPQPSSRTNSDRRIYH